MCFAVLSAILYAEGYYDFTFISREDGEQTSPSSSTQADGQTEQTQDGTESNAPVQSSQGQDDPVIIPSASGYLNNGYTVNGGIFDAEKGVIAKLPLSLPNSYVHSTILKPKTKMVYKSDGIERVFEQIKTDQNLYSVELYMGYIVVSEGNSTTIYNGDGSIAVDRFASTLGEFIYKYDESGRGVFTLNENNYVIENGAFVPAGKIVDNGFAYNISHTVTDKGPYYAFEAENGRWGYIDGDGKVEFSAKYDKAYNFSNGYGMVIRDGEMLYFNEDGGRECTGYYPVGENDLYSAGAIYFDGGLVLVRSITYERHDVIMDRDILVDIDGTEYEMPNGCNLVSYSNQRILLEKNGKYGFYATKNDWITDIDTYTYAQPYCEGLAVVGTSDGKKGVIDLDGTVVVPFEYNHITECCNGVFAAYSKTTGWSVFVKLSPDDHT